MKRTALALALLSLSLAAALPLLAQDDPPQDKPADRAEASAAPAQDKQAPAAAPQMSAEMQAMMQAWEKAATPGAQHKQLAEHFVGSWNTKQTMWMDESTPPMTETGKSVASAIFGGRHVREDFNSQWMGVPFEAWRWSATTTRREVSEQWTDSASTGQLLAEGDYDPASKTIRSRRNARPMKPGTQNEIREVVRIADQDRHVLEMYETRDGKERKTMEIEYTRAK